MLINTANIIVDVSNADQKIDAEVFNTNFTTCLDIEFSEIEDSWKTYSSLTVADGCIRLQLITKVNIQAFIQWTLGSIRMDEDPSALNFNVINRNNLIKQYNTHNQWADNASTMANNAMTKSFTKKMERMDWKSNLIKFLKSQPVRNRVTPQYVARDNQGTVISTNNKFLDDYINIAPLKVRAFSSDSSKVHSYLVRLIYEKFVS